MERFGVRGQSSQQACVQPKQSAGHDQHVLSPHFQSTCGKTSVKSLSPTFSTKTSVPIATGTEINIPMKLQKSTKLRGLSQNVDTYLWHLIGTLQILFTGKKNSVTVLTKNSGNYNASKHNKYFPQSISRDFLPLTLYRQNSVYTSIIICIDRILPK